MKAKEIGKLQFMIEEALAQGVLTELFDLIFSEAEIEHLQARYQIIGGLVKGQETQRELARRLKLSIAIITRGSNELKRQPRKLVAFLDDFYQRNR